MELISLNISIHNNKFNYEFFKISIKFGRISTRLVCLYYWLTLDHPINIYLKVNKKLHLD